MGDDPHICEGCGREYHRRRTETRSQFAARRFCSRACAVRRPHAGRRRGSPRELVRCAACLGLFEAIPSRIDRSKSGRLYCSVECQAEDRRRGQALASRPVSEERAQIAAEAATGRHSLAALAEEYGTTIPAVTAVLNDLGVSITQGRSGKKQHGGRVRSPLGDRIDALYMERTGARTPRGSRSWFAAILGVVPTHLSKILRGRYPEDRVVEAVRRMEREFRS